MSVLVDTFAPTIVYKMESFDTTSDGILLHAEFSDHVAEIYLDGKPYLVWDACSVCEYYDLEVGSIDVTIEVRDIAGNMTKETVTLTRLK